MNLPLSRLNPLEELNIPVLSITNASIIQRDIEIQPIESLPVCEIIHRPADCCPKVISKHIICCAQCIPKVIEERWTRVRSIIYRLVEHHYFEWFIIMIIFVSSITLVSYNKLREEKFSCFYKGIRGCE